MVIGDQPTRRDVFGVDVTHTYKQIMQQLRKATKGGGEESDNNGGIEIEVDDGEVTLVGSG